MSRKPIAHYGGEWDDNRDGTEVSPCGATTGLVAILWRNVTCKRCLRWREKLQAWEAKENCEA